MRAKLVEIYFINSIDEIKLFPKDELKTVVETKQTTNI
jgi:hypothetical protein